MNHDRIVKVLLNINIARRVSDHLLGEEHSVQHRMAIGTGLMIMGVGIAHMSVGYFTIVTDVIGWAIHGTGVIPFIDWLTAKKMEAEAAKDVSNDVKHVIKEDQKDGVLEKSDT